MHHTYYHHLFIYQKGQPQHAPPLGVIGRWGRLALLRMLTYVTYAGHVGVGRLALMHTESSTSAAKWRWSCLQVLSLLSFLVQKYIY
jgi:hypothetical protein